MDQQELKTRTKSFGLDVIRLVEKLPRTEVSFVIRRQLLRSATSVGANYRSACRGRSKAEFIAKIGIALEEVDESIYWLELLVDANLIKSESVVALLDEANQLASIFVSSSKTAARNLASTRSSHTRRQAN